MTEDRTPRLLVTRRWIVEAEDARAALKAARAGQHLDQTAIPSQAALPMRTWHS